MLSEGQCPLGRDRVVPVILPDPATLQLRQADSSMPVPFMENLSSYRLRGGYRGWERAIALSPEAVITELEASGLRGRGGAGFPTGKKWRLVRQSRGDARYLVVNGAEGEPGSFKDRRLMAEAPHAVLEGILIAAHALGAHDVLFYINDQFQEALQALNWAIREAEAAGYLTANGENSVVIRLAPETHVYIAGEETALINVLMGRPAQPWHKPPYPSTEGYQGQPTAVNNVETLAVVAAILREGPEWFSTRQPALFSLSGDVVRPGVYELALGTPLSELIALAGGPIPGSQVQAVLPGGYSMPPIFPDHLDVPLDNQSLHEMGSGLGASVIVVGTNRTLREAAYEVLDFFARESCGKCPVCVKGTRLMADKIKGADHWSSQDFLTMAVKYRHKGICSFLDTAAHLAETTAPWLEVES